jgi:hypothetical protein
MLEIKNPLVLVFLGFLGLGFLIVGGFFAVPILLVIAIAAGIRYYNTHPPLTESLREETSSRVTNADFPDTDTFVEGHLSRLIESLDGDLPIAEIFNEIESITAPLYRAEDLNNPVPPLPPRYTVEEGRYRDQLIDRMRKLADPNKTLELFNRTLGNLWHEFIEALPPMARTSAERLKEQRPALATVPLLDVLPNPKDIVQDIYNAFDTEELKELKLFAKVRDQFRRNVLAASANPDHPILPADSKLPPRELVDAYLRDTPFERLLSVSVPFEVSVQKQLEHTMAVARTRWGKSQLIGSIIAQHLESDDPPGMFVLDSQGDFLEKISRLAVFEPNGRLADRLMIINPEDRIAPALNMFDTTRLYKKGYSEEEREQVEAEVIHLFNYVFAAIGSELTTRQGTGFSFLCRLLLSMPGSNINTLRRILEDPATDYAKAPVILREAIEKLDQTTIDYFKHQFFSRSVTGTRHQIAGRLYKIIQVPAFERMFSGVNKIDFFDAMQAGKIVVVNTAKARLKDDASALFGRYIIARVLSGAFERVVIKDMNKRKPCFLIVDEAQEYFDESMDTILSQASKFRLGLFIAFQYVDQLDQKLRTSVLGQTTVKYVGGVTYPDARHLAREMRTNEQMILAQKKDPREPPQWAQFTAFVQNYTETAVSLNLPFYALENLPKMTEEAYRRVLKLNQEQVATITDEPIRPTVPAPARKPAPAGPPPSPPASPSVSGDSY